MAPFQLLANRQLLVAIVGRCETTELDIIHKIEHVRTKRRAALAIIQLR